MSSAVASTTPEVRMMPVSSLKPAAYNPRVILKPGDAAYEKLKASICEFGLVEPLIWNESTGRVVGGHARLRILKALKVKEAPVTVVRLSVEREKALNLVLNNQEAQSRFDTAKLAKLLTELEPLPEFKLSGFDHRHLAALELKPVPGGADPEAVKGTVTVVLEMTGATFEQMTPEIDRWVAEHDLVSHIHRA